MKISFKLTFMVVNIGFEAYLYKFSIVLGYIFFQDAYSFEFNFGSTSLTCLFLGDLFS